MTLEPYHIAGINTKLGARYSRKRQTLSLAVWAPAASAVVARFFATEEAAAKAGSDPDSAQGAECRSFALKHDPKTGVWRRAWTAQNFGKSFGAEDIGGWFYDFLVTNGGETKRCLDPYAPSMAEYRGDGAFCAGAIVDFEDERCSAPEAPQLPAAEAASRASSAASGGGAAGGSPCAASVPRRKTVVYEISVRDFTISPDSGVKAQAGTYQAFAEKLPYLKRLGVSHVQLLPVLNFYNNDEARKGFAARHAGSNYNWGYDPHQYFAPEGWYASAPEDPHCRVRELRRLVAAAHAHGLKVLLDVVYNHMAKTDFLEDIVPGYYFRRNAEGGFASNSGCGNDTASERFMVKKLIIDSLVHWVRNYDVDGFRFDLMGLLESSVVLDGYKACRRLKKDVLFLGEGWKMYNGARGAGMDQNLMRATNRVAVFNDEFRDLVKAGGMNECGLGFVTNFAADVGQLFYNHTGRPQRNYAVCDPCNNVQYVAAHDGLTLHDAVCNNCGLDEGDAAQRREVFRRIKLANFLALTAQGIAFLHGGQERGRTKLAVPDSDASKTIGRFVRDSYNTADSVNAFVWKLDGARRDLLEYTQSLIAFRNATEVFTLGSLARIENCVAPLRELWADFLLVYRIRWGGKSWHVVVNAANEERRVALRLKNPQVYCDTAGAALAPKPKPKGVRFDENGIAVEALSAFVIVGERL